MTAPARFRQADLERVFKAAKAAEVRIAVKINPTGDIEAQMLTDDDDPANEADALRKKVFGGSKA